MNNGNNEKIIFDENNNLIINSKINPKPKLNKIFIVGGIYFFCVLLFVLFRILSQTDVINNLTGVWADIVPSCIIQLVILFAIPLTLYLILTKSKIKQTFKDFRFKKISAKSVLFSFIIGFGIYFLVSYVSGFLNSILTFLGMEGVPQNTEIDYSKYSVAMFFLTILLTAILPAIFEEFIHRGMLLGTASKHGIVFAIVTSSLAFGFLHMNIRQCFYAILIGFFLGYVCVYTKSIFPCMIIHFMNNFMNTLFDFCYVNDWLGGGFYKLESLVRYYLGSWGGYLFGVIIFVSALALVVYFSFKLIKTERLDKEVEGMSEQENAEYKNLKETAQFYPAISQIREATKSKLSFFIYNLKKKAKRNGVTMLGYLEQPQGKVRLKWFDCIFLYSGIGVAIFYCFISYLSFVV